MAEDNDTALAQKLQELFKETQAVHAEQPMTEEEIAAEIEAARSV